LIHIFECAEGRSGTDAGYEPRGQPGSPTRRIAGVVQAPCGWTAQGQTPPALPAHVRPQQEEIASFAPAPPVTNISRAVAKHRVPRILSVQASRPAASCPPGLWCGSAAIWGTVPMLAILSADKLLFHIGCRCGSVVDVWDGARPRTPPHGPDRTVANQLG
jgi:hypothetical protein